MVRELITAAELVGQSNTFTRKQLITPSVDETALAVRQHTWGTGNNIFAVQDHNGTDSIRVDQFGAFEARQCALILPVYNGAPALIVQNATGQSVPLQRWRADDGATSLARIEADGKLGFEAANEAATASAGAATLPAAPVGFFTVKDSAGTTRKIPYYAT